MKIFRFEVNCIFSNCLFFSLILAAMICLPQIVLANTITSVDVESTEVTINQNTNITVHGTGMCNFSLDFGDGSTATLRYNFDKGSYQTSHSWNSAGTKTVEARSLKPCTGIAQNTVIVTGGTTQSTGKEFRKVREQKIEAKPKYEVKPSSTPKMIVKPKIESVLTSPCCALNPGTKLYLKGSFGNQPGKILMCFFPENCLELENIKWESSSKVNGTVPLSMQGRSNEKVVIKVLAAAPPEDNYSNVWQMDFIGKPYCGKGWDEQHIIYKIDGKIGRDCTPYRCVEDQIGVDCKESCISTGDCKKGYQCSSDAHCVVPQK